VAVVPNTLKGFGVTLKQVFKKPITQQYPEYKRPVYPRFRGRHRLWRHENGLEKCVGCSLCAAACPADCIRVVPAENTPDNRVSAGERYARIYEINMSRCIFCGYCELACPFDAITLGNHAFRHRDVYELLDSDPRIIRPSNYPKAAPGSGRTGPDTTPSAAARSSAARNAATKSTEFGNCTATRSPSHRPAKRSLMARAAARSWARVTTRSPCTSAAASGVASASARNRSSISKTSL